MRRVSQDAEVCPFTYTIPRICKFRDIRLHKVSYSPRRRGMGYYAMKNSTTLFKSVVRTFPSEKQNNSQPIEEPSETSFYQTPLNYSTTITNHRHFLKSPIKFHVPTVLFIQRLQYSYGGDRSAEIPRPIRRTQDTSGSHSSRACFHAYRSSSAAIEEHERSVAIASF